MKSNREIEMEKDFGEKVLANCICIVDTDEDLTIQSANSAFYQLAECTKEDLQRRYASHMSALLEPEIDRKIHRFIKNKNKMEELIPEHTFLNGDRKIWVCSSLKKLNNQKLVWQIRYIDKCKLVEDMLLHLEQRSTFVTESLGFLLFEYSLRRGELTHLESGAWDWVHLKVGGNIQPILELDGIFREDGKKKLEAVARQLKRTGKPVVLELEIKAYDHQFRWARVHMGCPYKDNPDLALCLATDISVEKEVSGRYLEEVCFYQSVLADQDAYCHLDVTENKILRGGGIWYGYSNLIKTMSFMDILTEFVNKDIHPEDRIRYIQVMQIDNLLSAFENGNLHLGCEFRRIVAQDEVVLMKLSVYLFRSPITGHVMSLVFLKNVDGIFNIERTDPSKNTKMEVCASSLENAETGDFDYLVGCHGDMAYLVNPQTYEFMTGNRSFYSKLGKTPWECREQTCYRLLYGRTSPCPFCRNTNWSMERFYIFRNYNEILKQEYLVKNKLVIWKGKETLLALSVHLPGDKSVTDSIGSRIEENDSILSGIQHMQSAESLDGVMKNALEAIGFFYRAEAVRFWIYEEDSYTLASSWHTANGMAIIKKADREFEMVVSDWLKKQDWKESLIIENPMQMLNNSLEMHYAMTQQDIENEWWLDWSDHEGRIGFIELDNMKTNIGNQLFLSSLLAFTANEWKKRKLLNQIVYANCHDGLTGVGNRNSYETFLNQYEPDEVKSMAAVLVNVNGMKEINMDIGVEGGNRYLCHLADILKQIFGPYQISRLNGDEFLVLISGETQETVEHMVSDLEEMVCEEGTFTIAVGYSWDDVEKELSDLVAYATQVMKQNKLRHYEQGFQGEKREKSSILQSVLKIIEDKEMMVYIQPKIDSRTGELAGAEALVRIYHKEYGVIPPVKFIGQLEKHGLIRYVDLFVFERTLEILDEWKKKGYQCPKVSVNFSRLTLMEQDLKKTLDYIVGQHQVPKEWIELEITESYEDVGKAIIYQAVKKLHGAGYQIALDDFGTKYTNLSILSDIHVDILKLDRSLVNSLIENEKNRIILQNIISMCDQLSIEVVAEGVETKEQENILSNMGCYLIQGYLYSKPVPAEKFEEQFL